MEQEFAKYSWLFVVDPLRGAMPAYEREVGWKYHVFGQENDPGGQRLILPLSPCSKLPELANWVASVFKLAGKGGFKNYLSDSTAGQWGLDTAYRYHHDDPEFTGVLAYDRENNFGAFLIDRSLKKTAKRV